MFPAFALLPSNPTVLPPAPNPIVLPAPQLQVGLSMQSPFLNTNPNVIRSNINVLSETPFSATSPIVTKIPVNYISPYAQYNVNTGLENNYLAQKQVTKYMLYRTLDKWLPNELSKLLSYLKYDASSKTVSPVSSIKNLDSNKSVVETDASCTAKIDYIEAHILNMESMRRVLIRVIEETPYKYYELPQHENFMINVMKKYLKQKLLKLIPDSNV